MGRRDIKSNRVGRVTLPNGVITTAYRAVGDDFICVQCASRIAPGALFSRQTRRAAISAMGAPTTDPVCVTCRPLRLEDEAEDL